MRRLLSLAVVAFWLGTTACRSNGERIRLLMENDSLRRSNEELERSVAKRDASLEMLKRQVADLQALGPDRPFGQFAPIRLEIASLSGGSNFDQRSGDDGVTVHLRPLDADGDVVKAPGRVRIELLDGSSLGSPRVLGLYTFEEPDQLRQAWHGKFLTQHYTFRCPFPPDMAAPPNRRVLIRAEFLDYLTGATLSAMHETTLSIPDTK